MKALDWLAAAVAFLLMYLFASFLIGALDVHGGWNLVLAVLCGGHSGYWTLRSLRQARATQIKEDEEARRARNLCPKCEYDLTGNTSGRCPECGQAVEHAG